jgi:polyphenol oxidase
MLYGKLKKTKRRLKLSKEPFIKEQELVFNLELWTQRYPKLVAGFTTKNGGNSNSVFHSLNMGLHVGDTVKAVVENREKLASLIEIPLTKWVCAEQTHNDNIYVVTSEDHGKGTVDYTSSIKDTDGFITINKGTLLTMCYADCVPLYFFDTKLNILGLAHAGWKGSVAEIGPKMIREIIRLGSDINDIEVVIGPSICEKCYTVDNRVIDKVEKILDDEREKPYNLKERGQYSLDLKMLNSLLLKKAGVLSSNIFTSGYCSSCDDQQFYSHRRDEGKTGRMMSFIGWKE